MEKLFTHADLDGAACAVLFKILYPEGDVTYCASGTAPERIRAVLNRGDIPHVLVITDVSVDDEVAEELKHLQDQGVKVAMYDHHETSMPMKGYSFATVHTRLCAAALYFNSMRSNPRAKDYNEFIRLVNVFDNYQIGNREFPKAHQLNKIMEYHKETGSLNAFVNRFLDNPDCNPDNTEEPIIEYILLTDRKYIEAAARRALVLPGDQGVKKAVVPASRCINDIAQKVMADHPEVAFVEVVDMERESVSVRSRGKFNVCTYAESKGGGGHKDAAGYRISFDLITSLLG